MVISEIISLISSSITPTRVDFLRSKGFGVVMIFIGSIITYLRKLKKSAMRLGVALLAKTSIVRRGDDDRMKI